MMLTKEPDITFKGLYYFPAFPISKAVQKCLKWLKAAKVLLVILLMQVLVMSNVQGDKMKKGGYGIGGSR